MYTPEEKAIIDQALFIIESKAKIDPVIFDNANSVRKYLTCMLVPNEREIFLVLFLDTQHRLICSKEMFMGTIDRSSVHPREVVKEALRNNAAAVILAHNHPSGIDTPSQSDINITNNISKALELIDIRLLDHFVVATEGYTSLAENGYI